VNDMFGVVIKHLKKKFGKVIAIDNLDIEVGDKEFLALLGPSGCGKTTTLRCIAGLETPDEGEIYIAGKLVSDLPPRERDVAMVFQSYALYPHMTAFDNIAFPLKIRKIHKQEIKKRVKEVADLLQIGQLLDRKPKALSGGQAQRVALGRAIIRQPKVFLMDEPLSNLDAKLRDLMRVELKRLQKELAITTVYVTHDQSEAMSLGDRIAIMNQGILQQLGSPNEIYRHPDNIFVANFMGRPPANLIRVSFVEKNGIGYLDCSGFTNALSSEVQEIIKAKSTSSELVLGLKPEDITVNKERFSSECIEAIVYLVEPLGSETIADLRVGEDLIKAKISPDLELHMGEKVWIKFDEKKMHLFDGKTERSIL
jgi:multiple sugar transport system ATP-binding protein